jgi:CCR4-NOT transcription complex subunit 4
VPPGFEAHAHPIGSRPASRAVSPDRKSTPFDPKVQRVASSTILPAVPDLPIGPRSSTPKSTLSKGKEVKSLLEHDDSGTTAAQSTQHDISYGSPKPRVRQPALPEKQESIKPLVDAASLPAKPSSTKSPTKDSPAKKPTKIEIPTAAKTVDKGKSSKFQPPDTVIPAAAGAADVSTPVVATDRDPVPGPRPKTLRLTTTTTVKPSTPASEQVPQSATTEKSTPASTAAIPVPAKDAHHFPHLPASRQHSISSAPRLDKDSRPSTPMSEHSHPTSHNHSRMISEVASRASTPPAGGSIVGSAPERAKTKNQLKKERREKAKVKEQVEKEETVIDSPAKTTPVAEEVGPIISRQKKQKREKPAKKTEVTTAAKVNKGVREVMVAEKPVIEEAKPEEPIEDTADEPVLESPAPEPEPEPEPEYRAPYTLAQLYSDAAKPGAPSLTSLIAANTSSFDRILNDILASSDYSRDHTFLAPPSLTSKDYKLPHDSRKGEAYLNAHGYTVTSAFDYNYIRRSARRELLDGSPIVLGEEPDKNGKEDLLKNTLISPSGAVLRHLTTNEIDRTLELEGRRLQHMEEFGTDIGGMQALATRLEVNDNINLEGGVDEIVRHGEGKGVVWVYDSNDEDGDDDGETEDDDLDGEYDDEDEKVWDSADEYGDVDEYEHDGVDGEMTLARERKVNLRAMADEELARRVAETQRETDAARKEVERLDKLMAKRSKEMAKLRESFLK